MTNREYLETLNDEELAKLLIKENVLETYEYDGRGNYPKLYKKRYITPSKKEFFNFFLALEETKKWLSKQRGEKLFILEDSFGCFQYKLESNKGMFFTEENLQNLISEVENINLERIDIALYELRSIFDKYEIEVENLTIKFIYDTDIMTEVRFKENDLITLSMIKYICGQGVYVEMHSNGLIEANTDKLYDQFNECLNLIISTPKQKIKV